MRSTIIDKRLKEYSSKVLQYLASGQFDQAMDMMELQMYPLEAVVVADMVTREHPTFKQKMLNYMLNGPES